MKKNTDVNLQQTRQQPTARVQVKNGSSPYYEIDSNYPPVTTISRSDAVVLRPVTLLPNSATSADF